MDRRVKERLVGASILVVLIVLIVPELLSGPAPPAAARPAAAGRPAATAPEAVRNVTVDLATSKAPAGEPPDAGGSSSSEPPAAQAAAASAAAASVAASGDEGNATPAASESPTSQPAAILPPATLPASERAAPSARVERAPQAPTNTSARAVAGGTWAVQLGSFASRANADKLMRQLKAQGFPVYVVSGGSGSSLRYRVRVGPMADRGAAVQTAAKLKALGHASSFVPPAR